MAYKIFRPRRGKKSYMDSSGTILAKGEMFFEVPESGVGTGNCKVKMGDGVSDYATLPYAIDAEAIDVSTSEITFSESTSTTNSVLLGEIVSGATVASLFGSIKKLLSNLSDSVTELNNDSSNWATLGDLTNGSVTKIGTSTVGGSNQPIYLSSGSPTTCNTFVPNSGGTFTGNVTFSTSSANYPAITSSENTTTAISISNSTIGTTGFVGIGTSGNFGIYNRSSSSWAFAFTTDNEIKVGTSTVGGSKQPIYLKSGVPTTCNSFMSISGDTFTGVAYAQTNTSYTTYQLRNIAFTTSTPSSLTNGHICMVYS